MGHLGRGHDTARCSTIYGGCMACLAGMGVSIRDGMKRRRPVDQGALLGQRTPQTYCGGIVARFVSMNGLLELVVRLVRRTHGRQPDYYGWPSIRGPASGRPRLWTVGLEHEQSWQEAGTCSIRDEA